MEKQTNDKLSSEILEKSLKLALKSYWSIPENHKIDGKECKELLNSILTQDWDYRIPIRGTLVGQLDILREALENNSKLPTLHGRFQVEKNIDNGNATRTIDCEFELLGEDYQIGEDGSISIKNLFTHIR